MIRAVNLIALVFIGVLAGYLVMTGWKRLDVGGSAAEPATTTAPAAAEAGPEADEAESSPVSATLPPLATPRRGSSVSVVGGMSPEELARLQRELQGTDAEADAPGEPGTVPPAGGAPVPPDATPASVLFSPAVREAARLYLCLCGCGHDLAVCPCNDQPVG